MFLQKFHSPPKPSGRHPGIAIRAQDNRLTQTMAGLVHRLLQHHRSRKLGGNQNRCVGISFMQPQFYPCAPWAGFRQQAMQGMRRKTSVRMQLKRLVCVQHNREIHGGTRGLHTKNSCQEINLGQHVAHQKVDA